MIAIDWIVVTWDFAIARCTRSPECAVELRYHASCVVLKSDSDVKSDMVNIGSCMDSDWRRPSAVLVVRLQAFVVQLDFVHSMACQPNLRRLEVMMQQMRDPRKRLHTARQRQFAGACLSFADFGTTPDSKKKTERKKNTILVNLLSIFLLRPFKIRIFIACV